MPKKSRKARRLNDLADDLDQSSQSADDQEQLETLKEQLREAEKRAEEAEQRAAALLQSVTPSTPQSQPEKSPNLSTDTPSHPSPLSISSPVTDLELKGNSVSPAPVHKTDKADRKFEVPLPRQNEFNGTGAWEGFIRPFMGLAVACGWTAEEKKFRLMSSLKGKAAEFVFQQLDPSTINDFEKLISALESRFAERRTQNAWLALLEAKKLSPKDSLTEYVADIRRLVMRGYPTADETTRESIALRHFLKGLPDQQTTVAIGMTNPKTLEEARTAVENFTSLRENLGSGKTSLRVHAIQPTDDHQHESAPETNTVPKPDANFVTQEQMKQFSDKLDRRLTGIVKLIKDNRPAKKPSSGSGSGAKSAGNHAGNTKQEGRTDVTCFKCNEPGHFANKCPELATKEVVTIQPASGN